MDYLCAHKTFTCSCDVGYYTLTPPNSSAEENNPSLPNKLKVLFRSSHNQIEDGTAVTISSTRTERIDVIKNFKSCSLVVHKIVGILSDLKVPERCFDYVTDRILDSVSQIPAESLGGTYCVTACVKIAFEENLDVVVTESMEEDSESISDGSKKVEYRYHHGDNNNRSCAVCFEGILDGSGASLMGCAHMFHRDCLVTWLAKNNSCPVCGCRVETIL